MKDLEKKILSDFSKRPAPAICSHQASSMPAEVLKLSRIQKGTYILVIHLKQIQRISAGKLPLMDFEPGLYFYVGKAKKGLRARLNRHLSKGKKLFWHIDYFLQKVDIKEVWIKPDFFRECQVARQIKKTLKYSLWLRERFGSSDCLCPSHLLFFPQNKVNLNILREKLDFIKVYSYGA